MNSTIVADSSPLIFLLKSGLSYILPELFDSVLVPDAVWYEILAGPEDDIARRQLPNLSWISRISVSERNEAVDSYDLGRGESEVITVALSLGDASVLIDDSAARVCSKIFRLSFVGTGGLLLLAKRKGLLYSFSKSLEAVRSAGLWISPEIETLLLKMANE